ncbi:hypothetical protein AB0J86_31520 [Micromonospora sp. NPDC049559]|uniref:hypothetical protein n=1 Tax=Micromonospora sp. NPDC049559 TaxID=3155923 RepID=UPI00343F4A12
MAGANTLYAGPMGVAQDGDGALRPVVGWYVAPAAVRIDDVVDRIVRDHETTPPQPDRLYNASAELVALYRRIGSATLFGGAWRLLPAAEHRQIWRETLPIVSLIELADGRCIGAALDHETETPHWIACRVEPGAHRHPDDGEFRLVDEPADVPVYGTSLAMLLDAALDCGGDITHLQSGRLDELDSRAGADSPHP